MSETKWTNGESIDPTRVKKGDRLRVRRADAEEMSLVVTDVRQNGDGTFSIDVQDPALTLDGSPYYAPSTRTAPAPCPARCGGQGMSGEGEGAIAALAVIRADAYPLALVAKKQRGCGRACGCSDCEVLEDIERALALYAAMFNPLDRI